MWWNNHKLLWNIPHDNARARRQIITCVEKIQGDYVLTRASGADLS